MSILETEALTPAIGSLIHGLDLSEPDVVERHGDDLRQLLLDRQVIFFRGQTLDPDAQVRLSRMFGEVRPVASTFPSHPDNACLEILQSVGKRTGTDVWHADLTWQTEAPRGAVLYARDVPATGGDTIWASMTAAYDSLDEQLKGYLGTLSAIHDWEGPELLAGIRGKPDAEQRYHQMRQKYPPLEQPVVAEHPETGRKLVFVNALYTTRIVGVSRSESTALLTFLSSLAQVPEWQVRFRWQSGSVAIWDNRAVQHYAVNDYHPSPRLMHRVAVF